MFHKHANEIKADPKTFNMIKSLKNKIDQLGIIFSTIKQLILQLAIHLDEDKKCERDQICALIKKLLTDKIKEGKVSSRWIEDCLPNKYKRKYIKSEFASHLTTAGQQLVQEVEENQSIADSHGNSNDEALDKKDQSDTKVEIENLRQENAELKEALLKVPFRNGLNLELKFEVHKDKLIEIIGRLKDCSDRCYLIFNDQGGLVRIEADNMTRGMTYDSEQ
jgi:hypothetical protein